MQPRRFLLCVLAVAACSGPDPRRGEPGPNGGKPDGGRAAADGAGRDGAAPALTDGGPMIPPPREIPEFACNTQAAAPPPARRLTRLTHLQYGNALAVLFKGRRGPKNNYLTAPAGVTVPLEAMGDVYRFSTYSGTHSLSEFEFRRALFLTEDIARRLVAAVKAGTCWATATAAPAADACIDTLVKDKGALLFGRPLTAEEVAAYGKLAREGVATLGRDDALALAFQALLQAPQFLFRPEIGDPIPGQPAVARLTPYELATALSFALTDAPPDQELWDAATKGELATPTQVAAHVTRLLGAVAETAPAKDGKPATTEPLASGAREFLVQYFEMQRVLNAPKPDEDHCKYGRPRVLKDAKLVIEDILGTNARKDFVKTMLTSDVQYYGCDSSRIFGITQEPKMDTVKLMTPPGTRAGLLTHPAFLAAFANFDETAPVKRGKFVNESLLCRHVPEVPIGVVPQLPPKTPTTQARDRLSLHSKDPSCAACHSMMDPIGLAFEVYDTYGKYRTIDATKPINASGTLSGTDVDGPYKDAIELSLRLSDSRQVRQCFIRHGLRYFMGREESEFDGCTLEAAEKAYQDGGGDYYAFVTTLLASPSFVNRSY